jgi:hypothetical protein
VLEDIMDHVRVVPGCEELPPLRQDLGRDDSRGRAAKDSFVESVFHKLMKGERQGHLYDAMVKEGGAQLQTVRRRVPVFDPYQQRDVGAKATQQRFEEVVTGFESA